MCPIEHYLFMSHFAPMIIEHSILDRIHAHCVKTKEWPLKSGTMKRQMMEIAMMLKVEVVDGDVK